MIDLQFSTRSIERWAGQIGAEAKQLPFAMANAMNAAAFGTRSHLIDETWPAHVTVRNKSFMRGSLRVEKATKQNLTVAITDAGAPGRAHLALHNKGGTKQSRGLLAIPSRQVRRTARGVSKSQKPRVLPNSFRKGDAIFQRYGKGGHKLRLMYTLKPSARIKADVPLSRDFKAAMLTGVRKALPEAMARAMRPRR